jgi:ribosomal protein S27AE
MQGSVMPQARFSFRPSLTTIERPRCSRCTSRMMLARIVRGPVTFENRRFECPKCNYVQNQIVATDPMQSAYLGWLAEELRAPS